MEKIAKALDGPTLVRKGAVDGITNGTTTLHCDAAGSKRRAGGQVHPSTPCLTTSVVSSGGSQVCSKCASAKYMLCIVPRQGPNVFNASRYIEYGPGGMCAATLKTGEIKYMNKGANLLV